MTFASFRSVTWRILTREYEHGPATRAVTGRATPWLSIRRISTHADALRRAFRNWHRAIFHNPKPYIRCRDVFSIASAQYLWRSRSLDGSRTRSAIFVSIVSKP